MRRLILLLPVVAGCGVLAAAELPGLPSAQAVATPTADDRALAARVRYLLSACIGNARMDHHGKPVVLQEFGCYGGGTSKFPCDLPYRSEQEHADYTRVLTDALIPHVNGFINWPTFDMPAANDISNHGGIFTAEGQPKALAKVYADLVRRLSGQRQLRAVPRPH